MHLTILSISRRTCRRILSFPFFLSLFFFILFVCSCEVGGEQLAIKKSILSVGCIVLILFIISGITTSIFKYFQRIFLVVHVVRDINY